MRILNRWSGSLLVIMNIVVGVVLTLNGRDAWKNDIHALRQEHHREKKNAITFSSLQFIPVGDNQFSFSSNDEVEFAVVNQVILSVFSRGCDISDIDMGKGTLPGRVSISQFIITCRK